MSKYSLDISLERMHVNKPRSSFDRDYVHMEVMGVNPTATPETRMVWQMSRNCQPHQGAGPGDDLPLANQVEGWNRGEESTNQSLAFLGSLDENDILVCAYFVINQSGEIHEDRAKEKFDKTIDAFTSGVQIGAVLGGAVAIAFPPVGGVIAAVAGALQGALKGIKELGGFLLGEDSPPVNCDGEVLRGAWSHSVAEIVANTKGGSQPWAFQVRHAGEIDSPAQCGGPPDSELFFSISAEKHPEFNHIYDRGNPSEWASRPVVGGSNSLWAGTWGDTADQRTSRILCTIDAPPDSQPASPVAGPPGIARNVRRNFKVDLVEHQSSPTGPVLVQEHREDVFLSLTRANLGVSTGRLAVSPRPVDTLEVSDGIRLYSYAAYNAHGIFMEGRIAYVRKIPGSEPSVTWLQRSYRIG